MTVGKTGGTVQPKTDTLWFADEANVAGGGTGRESENPDRRWNRRS